MSAATRSQLKSYLFWHRSCTWFITINRFHRFIHRKTKWFDDCKSILTFKSDSVNAQFPNYSDLFVDILFFTGSEALPWGCLCRNFEMWFSAMKQGFTSEWRNIDDMFSRYGTISGRKRHTDGQTDRRLASRHESVVENHSVPLICT